MLDDADTRHSSKLLNKSELSDSVAVPATTEIDGELEEAFFGKRDGS